MAPAELPGVHTQKRVSAHRRPAVLVLPVRGFSPDALGGAGGGHLLLAGDTDGVRASHFRRITMKKQILSWVLALSLLLTMLPVSAMAAEDELAGDGLSVTESTQCTCGAELDADGAIVHQEAKGMDEWLI